LLWPYSPLPTFAGVSISSIPFQLRHPVNQPYTLKYLPECLFMSAYFTNVQDDIRTPAA